MPASKALKHKEGNKHRFLTFSERLSKVSINAVHHIVRSNEQNDTDDSKFHSSLVKWRDQDRSLHFREFYSEVANKSQNFNMVVHYRCDIMALLQKHLSIPGSLALEALCELLVALCIDLRSEIYPFFNDTFNILTKLLNGKELDRLEWVFNAISLLFKYLWKCMIADMESVLSLYHDLICSNNPPHIASFAAESLTFLIRKVPDQKKFYNTLFRMFANSEKGEEGVAKILFFVLKSTKGSLYSRAENILQNIFECLDSRDLNTGSIFNSIDSMMQMLGNHVERDHSQVIWDLLMGELDKSDETKLNHFMLKLTNTWCTCRNGYLILKPEEIVLRIKNLYNLLLSDEAIEPLIDLCVTILTTESSKFDFTLKESLLRTVIGIGTDKFGPSVLIQYWRRIITFVNSNTTARQVMLKFCQTHIKLFKHDIVHLLAMYILLNYEIPKDAKELSSSKPFVIEYVLISRDKETIKIQDVLKHILQDEKTENSLLWCSLLLVQHIRPCFTGLLQVLVALCEKFCMRLKSPGDSRQDLALMRMVLQTIVMINHKSQDKVLQELFCSKFLSSLIKNHCQDHNALFIVDMLLTFKMSSVINPKENFEITDLYSNLSCPDTLIRKFSLRILSALYPDEDVFKTCLLVEETSATIQTYRTKSLYLSRLKYSPDMSIETAKAVLRFLVSNLFINFSSYWPLVQSAISSFIPDDGKSPLWDLFFDLLKAGLNPVTERQVTRAEPADDLHSIIDIFEEHGLKISFSSEANSKPDYFNYRFLFWKTLGQFPNSSIIERNNKHVVNLFISYLDTEYYKVDKSYAPYQDITVKRIKNEKSGVVSLGKNHAIKTLNAILFVLSRFKNPSACVNSERLKSIYEDLLMHGDSDVQLSALTCLLTYREKSVMEFKEQLKDLLDDDKIKETMLQFNLSEIEDEKREILVPVLFRLMYGRMISKSGVGGQGRRRRSAVLRFLCGLKQSEMQAFIFLAIGPVLHYVDDQHFDIPLDDSYTTGCNPKALVPLSRQRGIINTLSEITAKHANLLSKYMFDFLLQVLLSMHLSYNKLIRQTDSNAGSIEMEHYLPFLRTLCKQAHLVVKSLIESWPETECLSSSQIESLFYVLIDPHIEKLRHECISQPNSLLHLLNQFSFQSKFVPLLGRKVTSSCIGSPVDALIETLISDKTSNAVSKIIMDMCIRMIGDENTDMDLGDADEKLVSETLVNMGPSTMDIDVGSHARVGLKLLSGHVGDLMKFFISKLQDRKNSGGLVHSHLRLLTALGDHVTDIELSYTLVELLLNHISGVSKRSAAEDKSVLPVLATVNALPLHSKFIPAISKLFSQIQSRDCRLILVEVLNKSCTGIPGNLGKTLTRTATIVMNMNAWDKRFIEELDFDSRLVAFQELSNWLDSADASDLLSSGFSAMLPLVHNCIFTLSKHCDDLSLRESATHALEQIINLVFDHVGDSSCFNIYHIIMSMILIPGIRKGLNSPDENQRHEWLRLLVKVAKLSSDGSPFSRLKILCNDSDPDSDFFSNVQHIQSHRRTRAFNKLAQMIVNPNSPDEIPYTIVSTYLLPLAMQTLKNQDLCKNQHLRDSCLEVVSSCAKVMPWAAYRRLLNHSIATKMQVSQGVRILCSVLDAFHFNVSSITEDEAIKLKSAYINTKSKNNEKLLQKDDELDRGEDGTSSNLDGETATIYTTITCDILPRLFESLSGKIDSDSNHRLADSTNYSDIDQCTIRAPLAIAVVSLLQKLPAHVLNFHLPICLLKIVNFLRHQYVEVRTVASKVIVQICNLLEPCHLPVVIKELKSGLTRGYQKHVLMHTINCVFSKLEPKFEIGDLDRCVGLVIKILMDDLFGKNEEERNIDKIKSKTPEARGRSKAYNLFRVFAKFNKKDSLSSFFTPLKTILDTTSDHKKRKIVDGVLVEIGQGLQENKGLTAEDIMIFLHGLLTENLPGLFRSDDASNDKSRKFKQLLRPESCFLLSTEPERYGVKPTKKIQKTNLHLLIEFAISFLNSSLKRQVISLNDQEHLQMLDPFISILKHCLESAHSKTVTAAVRCLTKLLRATLPSLSQNTVDVIKSLFKILRENSKGSVNNELAIATYKALSILCVSNLGSKLSDTQLQVLLAYAEEMLYERDKQSHAFNLIQSIINRGLQCEEVIQVMVKIRDICIQTHDNAAMVHARQVYIYFLTHYPMKKTVMFKHLEFVLAQLTFEYESGRLSSLELTASIINSFSDGMIKENAGVIFVPVSVMLINDESVKCRKIAAHVIKILLNKLKVEDRDQLFSLVIQWFGDKEQPLHQQLAGMLVTIFTEAEGMEFHRHLSELMPVLFEIIHSAVEKLDQEKENSDWGDENNEDHFLFHELSALHYVIRHCQLSRDSSWDAEMNSLLKSTEKVLLHPHMWVRIISSQIFGTIFASWEASDLLCASSDEKQCTYLTSDLKNKLKTLSILFCKQIQSPLLDVKLTDQCIKNLIYVVRVQHMMIERDNSNSKKTITNDDVELQSGIDGPISSKNPILLLLLKLSKTAKLEAANDIKETSKRTAILKFFAALSISLSDVDEYLHIILDPVYRESERMIVEEDEVANSLKTLAGEVLGVIKSKVGSTAFTRSYSRVQRRASSMRRERKRKRDVDLVTDPQKAAAAKTRRQLKKKGQRKRKITSLRPLSGAALRKRKKVL